MALPELIANQSTPGSVVALTTLSSELKTGVTTMEVGAAAPAALQGYGQFRVVVGSEIILVEASSASSTKWTVLERKAEGSTEAAHAAGASVYHFLTRSALENLVSSPLAQLLGAPLGAQSTIRGDGELGRSRALHRAAYEEATVVDEFTTVSAWTQEAVEQVQASSNKLYGGAKTGAGKGLATRALPSAPGETGNFRIVAQIQVKLSDTNEQYVGIGVSNEEAAAWTGLSAVLVNLKTAAVGAYYSNAGQGATIQGSSTTALTEGTYVATVEGDGNGVSFTLMKTDRSIEAFIRIKRSTAGAIKRIAVINQDTRTTSGAYIGPYIGARNSTATLSPRTNLEGVGVSRVIRSFDSAGTGVRVEFPAGFDSRIPPIGYILYCHQAETTDGAPMEQESERAMIKALVEAGFVIASSAEHNEGFGTNATIEDVQNLYRYLRSYYPLAPVILGGASAGGSTVAVTLHRRAIPAVAGAFIISGALNILGAKGHSEKWAEEILEKEYALNSTWSNGVEKVVTPGLEPMMLVETEPWQFRDVPLYILASSEDPVVNAAINGEQFASKLGAHGAKVTTEFGAYGTHMASTNFRTTQVKEFCEKCVLT